MKNQSQGISIDLETLGVTPDAVIMSIGAIKFNIETGEIDDASFYSSVSVESNLDLGRRIGEDTLIWWMKQAPAAQAVFHEPKDTLGSALIALADWIGDEEQLIWSNGASFDIPMMEHAFAQLKMERPWPHYNTRCLRTLKNMPFAPSIEQPARGTKHNALDDARNQAAYIVALWTAMKAVA